MGNPHPTLLPPHHRPSARLPALISVSLLCLGAAAVSARSAVDPIGDFAPLAAGNTWTYQGKETMGCKALQDDISVRRVITVDSSRATAEGTTHFLSYRDSVHWTYYGRWRISGPKPADVVRKGRFRVLEKTGKPELRVAPDGAGSPPSEMEFFFRSRAYPADWVVPDTGAWQSGGEVRYRRAIRKTVTENVFYAKGVGMTRLSHDYNVYNTNSYTAPERVLSYALIAFNGKTVSASGPEDRPYTAPANSHEDVYSSKDFAPVAAGSRWVYLGIRRVDSAGTVSRDSICRTLTVKSGSAGDFVLDLEDSLYARLRADQPLGSVIQSAVFQVWKGVAQPAANRLGIGLWEFDSDPSWSDPLRFFNGKIYPERDIEELAFPEGPRSVVVYTETSPGILFDTTVYAEGVGLVRRAKTMDDGRKYAEEFRLVEFQGKPFQAIPVSLSAPAAHPVLRRAASARLPVRSWRGRDAAGKALREPASGH